jgi:hypothetical protein
MNSLKLAHIEEIIYVNVTRVLWNWHILKKLFMWMLHEFFETGTYWNCLCECYMSSLKLVHIEIVYVNVTWVLWNWHILKRLFMQMLHEFFVTGTYWRNYLCECYMSSLKLAHIEEIVYVNVTW